jgi:hypothetical protein
MRDDFNYWCGLVSEIMAEVDRIDWSLIEVQERVRASKEAVASSRELLARLEEQALKRTTGSAAGTANSIRANCPGDLADLTRLQMQGFGLSLRQPFQ